MAERRPWRKPRAGRGRAAQPRSSEAQAAYYILQGKQIESPDWPAQYSRYALFICNPASVSAAQLERAKRDRPDGVFLAYTCFGWAYIEAPGCARFPEPKNEYYEAFNAHFDHALAVTDVATGHPLCVVDHGPVSTDYNVAGYVVTPAAAEQLAAFHATVTLKRAPFDGVYIVSTFDRAGRGGGLTLKKRTSSTARFQIAGSRPSTTRARPTVSTCGRRAKSSGGLT